MSVDSRVYCTANPTSAKSVGTIRYVGSIPPTAGEWLGIEWDDPTRGKHDGVHDKTGVRYFECRNKSSSTCASFIRPNSKGLNHGRSFAQALKAKYLDALYDDTTSAAPTSKLDHPPRAEGSSGTSQYYDTLSNFKVEVVDLYKIKKTKVEDLKRLKQAGLEWEGVNGTGWKQGLESTSAQEEHAEVIKALQALEKLDLSYSLLPTLQSVAEVVQGLTRLRHLALKYVDGSGLVGLAKLGLNEFFSIHLPSASRFTPLGAPTILPAFCNLKQLDLNATMISWAEIIQLSSSLSSLEELQLGDNDLFRLNPASALVVSPTEGTAILLPKLKVLNLTRNRLESWDDIVFALRGIPSLESLVLSYNALSSLLSTIPPPPSLKHLTITRNNLVLLPRLPATLKSVELSQNPFANTHSQAGMDESVLRMMMIALYPGLERFERTEVGRAERRDAEIWWVGKVGKEERGGFMRGWVEGEVEGEVEWVERRVEELGGLHHLEPPVPIAAPTRVNPKARLLNLYILLPPSLNVLEKFPLSLSILPTLRTLVLRTQISKLISKPLLKTKCRLVALLRTQKGDELVVPIPVGEEGRLVGWWGLQDGDAVRVEEV
ncbi:BZ3500_MvSof-1268-A1-R1_Chr8-1g09991 [Microbotryum saponariae]|uniref:BZ3500_MvSof-1268-A1-R1_Chr8-1g09991 protein n=1 Tax=Microbotryum saponariae TaxID=289078 RepID=A0A2X0LAX0_9BASI|nr:BZ3500_MvSof-1268-A1-R1_Chr8-1g09991 [Microbotryum saponariae]SDA08277.1 BZ3501_MvSof-1269-A2-R1_Chr8-1g09714 [Microbotryum saponariae]